MPRHEAFTVGPRLPFAVLIWQHTMASDASPTGQSLVSSHAIVALVEGQSCGATHVPLLVPPS
jgi:hypothetical protein